MSYHLKNIPKGKIGEFSKIKEEFLELEDALEQNNKIMTLCELSDIIGAIEHFLLKNFPGFSIEDLQVMKEATHRAFKSGHRK